MELILDVWEGSLDINEQLLREQDVRGLIIRLNDMNGGHHRDMTFDTQWAQAQYFLRAPYFVYNPWVSGQANYNWMVANLPASGVTRLFIDIEVRYTGYSPEIYADEVAIFMNLTRARYPLAVIYTGGWFLSVLSHWPAGDYWWARYPFAFYPESRESWTWEQLKIKIHSFGYYPDPTHGCPGTAMLWQFSGDRLMLPGCADRAMDVNVWAGDLPSLEAWWGAQLPPAPGLTVEQKVEVLWAQALVHGWTLPIL